MVGKKIKVSRLMYNMIQSQRTSVYINWNQYFVEFVGYYYLFVENVEGGMVL
jgi:hypothetical protein